MIQYITLLDLIKENFKGSGMIVIYGYEQRLLKKFMRDVEELGIELKIKRFDSIIYFDKNILTNFSEIKKLLNRSKIQYELF